MNTITVNGNVINVTTSDYFDAWDNLIINHNAEYLGVAYSAGTVDALREKIAAAIKSGDAADDAAWAARRAAVAGETIIATPKGFGWRARTVDGEYVETSTPADVVVRGIASIQGNTAQAVADAFQHAPDLARIGITATARGNTIYVRSPGDWEGKPYHCHSPSGKYKIIVMKV